MEELSEVNVAAPAILMSKQTGLKQHGTVSKVSSETAITWKYLVLWVEVVRKLKNGLNIANIIQNLLIY